MIHRESRDRLAIALRHFVAGLITNDDLEDVDIDRRDRGAAAVQDISWRLYDDMKCHYAVNEHGIDKQEKRYVTRLIAFLYTDNEYQWPENSFREGELVGFFGAICNFIMLGRANKNSRIRWLEFTEAGDFSVWPFLSRAEFNKAIKNPRLLSGLDREEGELHMQ